MARKKITRTVPNPNARQLWLAGLGLASMAGRGTVAATTQTVDRIAEARRQTTAAVEQAQARLIETAGELRSRVEVGVAQAGLRIEDALAPLVAKFKPGKAKRARRGRKPAARKPARRASAKKPATKPARRARKA